MLSRALVITLCLTVPNAGPSQNSSKPRPLEGVWTVVETVRTGADASTNSNPQPSLAIFTKGHYSYLSVTSEGPRPQFAPAKDPNKLTDAEKIARFEQWSPFTANAGTYEVKGTTLIRHPLVAKNEAVMAKNSSFESEFKVQGNTLWAVTKSPAGEPASETRIKLRRVE
jgi:hypothetical protein